MDAFRWIAVVLSTILGLGIARILSGFVVAFKTRHQKTPDWLPLLFAAVVLGETLQFWWAIAELSGRGTWSLVDFTLLVTLVLLLFLSAALIIPTDAEAVNATTVFERDGRWALLLLAGFHLTALIANWCLWDQSLFSIAAVPVVLLAALCLVGAIVSRRSVQQVVAVLYCILSVIGTLIESQAAYTSG
ncbi:MAG: hypothetical protein KDK07_05470 [Bauldia sp.]|nr:hypothetical protein [Bauldia sp.]